jgi:hypothetical protein
MKKLERKICDLCGKNIRELKGRGGVRNVELKDELKGTILSYNLCGKCKSKLVSVIEDFMKKNTKKTVLR